jgi:hypothetical protein
MRKPDVTYNPDETIKKFIRKFVGSSDQDLMIGSEILFGAGLASRELTLLDGRLTIHFRASPAFESRLVTLQHDRVKHPEKSQGGLS